MPIEKQVSVAQLHVRTWELGIEFNRALGGPLGSRHHFGGRIIVGGRGFIGLGKRGVEARILRIDRDSFLKILNGFTYRFSCALPELVQAEKIFVIALDIKMCVCIRSRHGG